LSSAPASLPTTPASPPRGFARLASALASRNFRLLWCANVLSTSGTWMQKVAQNWLVLTIGGSPFWLGLDAFVGELPILLLTLVGGVIADRHDRRWLLIGSQLVQAACAFLLAALAFGGAERVPIAAVLALSFCAGVAQAFGGPAYQSLLPALVPRADLPNAVALNSLQFNLSRILGPLVASLTLAAAGLTICFVLNGLSFFVVVGALLLIRLDRAVPNVRRSIAQEMRTGLSYVKQRPELLELTLLGFLTTFLAFPLQTLLPVMAREVFRQGIDGYSHLMIVSGAGAVLGAALVAWRGRAAHMGRDALVLGVLVGLLLIGFASARSLAVAYPLLLVTSVALIIVTSTAISLAQLAAPDEMRGRVMSIFMVAFRGGLPLGGLAVGALASATSAPIALAACGAGLIAVSVGFLVYGRGVKAM
jgi:MFS family permease